MNKYRVRLGDKTYDVELDELRGSTIAFRVEGERYETSIERVFVPSARASSKASIPTSAAPLRAAPTTQMPGQVASPMPGIIVSIGVKEGQKIDVGQVVAVMEAMKMENNIAATTSGMIKEIKVSVGQEVRGGEVLVVIEPD